MDCHRFALVLLLAVVATVPAQAGIDDARAKGVKWLVQTQKGDGSFAGLQGLEVQSTAATVEAMRAAGLTKSPQYARALAWLANAPGGSLDARAWQAAAIAEAGRDASSIAGSIRDERNTVVAIAGSLQGGTVTWGSYPGYSVSMIDTALGYGALRSAGVSYSGDTNDLKITVLCSILPAQLTVSPWSGSWPHALPQNGQPIHISAGSLAATSFMLYELKRQMQAGRISTGGTSCNSYTAPASINTAMTSAKAWLIAQSNADGGFAERNPQNGTLEASSPAATAMAIRALTPFATEGDSAANTALTNARNWLVAQQSADGSWRSDPFVTARVLAAFPAASGVQIADTDSDGLPDVVEQQLGSQTSVADAQSGLPTNGNAQEGITATAFSAAGTLGQLFAYGLLDSGGAAPFSYVRTGGSLPPGLSLAANGQISGTPTSVGSYAFDYEVTDALGAKTLVIGRIDITEMIAAIDGDVPIPAWALIALGGALLSAIRRKAA